MRSILCTVVIAALTMSLTALAVPIQDGAWEQLPDDQKVEFKPDYSSARGLIVQAFILTCDNYRSFFDDPETDCSAVRLFSHILGDRTPMVLIISNPTDRNRRFYGHQISLTQEYMQWSVDHDHIIFGDSAVSPGVTIGLIGIPRELDHSRTFWLWYADDYGVVGPSP